MPSIVNPGHASLTVHTDWGWNPPEGPGSSVPFNIHPQHLNKNPTGTFEDKKPAGYRGLEIWSWLRTSDALTGTQKIYMDMKVGQLDNDLAPVAFYGQSIILDLDNSGVSNYTKWKKYYLKFYGFDGSIAHPMFFNFERRCDLTNVDTEVWHMNHHVQWVP